MVHSALHSGHLVEKGHPFGVSMGLGTSPVSTILLLSLAALGSAIGAALISAFV